LGKYDSSIYLLTSQLACFGRVSLFRSFIKSAVDERTEAASERASERARFQTAKADEFANPPSFPLFSHSSTKRERDREREREGQRERKDSHSLPFLDAAVVTMQREERRMEGRVEDREKRGRQVFGCWRGTNMF